MKIEAPVFLTAEWRDLVMLNYEIEPAVLAPFVPAGTELDVWNGKIFVSVVGFMFLNTRVKGIPIPFHQNFEEVNLRFYVRRKAEDGWRRGVVFIKELVPQAAIAWVARTVYNENYVAVPMLHRIEKAGEAVKSAAYGWRFKGGDYQIKVVTKGAARPSAAKMQTSKNIGLLSPALSSFGGGEGGNSALIANSEAEFITEHYWGYARQQDGSTMEYRVEHPRWRVWEAQTAELRGDMTALYGAQFGECLKRAPASAFLAEGSEVSVYSGVRIG